MSISTLILTKNEETILPECLASLAWCDDIVVLDSFSTDRTVEIAKAFGARVYQRVYDNEDSQHNFGLHNIEYKHPWLYIPDADEITTPELRDEMLSVVSDPSRQEVAYRCRFKNFFMGRWIKHASLYPTWVVRLVRPERARFSREINSRCEIDGPEGRLAAHFHHFSFNKGLTAWLDKHNRYSRHEARESIKGLDVPLVWRDLISRRPDRRRRFMKEFSFRLPFRPTLRFLYMYVVRRGFLDGRAGLIYCRLLYVYEYMIVVKISEIRRGERGEAV